MINQFSWESPSTDQKLTELERIGMISSDFLSNKSTIDNFIKLIDKVFGEETCIEQAKALSSLTTKTFYLIGLQLLGYEVGVDFTPEHMAVFCAATYGKRLQIGEDKPLTNHDFINLFYDLLCTKGKSNETLLDVAISKGFLSGLSQTLHPQKPLIFNGKTLPVFNASACVWEKVYVESPQDTDQDGKRDLLAVYIKRPTETENGFKAPVIYVANPYALGTNDDAYVTHNVDCDLTVKPETHFSKEDVGFLPSKKAIPKARTPKGEQTHAPVVEPMLETMGTFVDYFLPRGYATVVAGGIGTRGSEGIRTCGSADETISTIAVVEWLCGKRKAYTNQTDHIEIKAWWCNQSVAMTGKSYLGTLAIAAASSGVSGLKTVIPEASISNWYNYYRCNGINASALGWQGDDADLLADYCLSRFLDPEDYSRVSPVFSASLDQMKTDQDRELANYNRFWDERNYLNDVKNTKASVFIVHGLNDWNVKPTQFDGYWKALQAHGITAKMILHQGDHIYINHLQSIDFNDIMNVWLTHALFGVENNAINRLPQVLVQNNQTVATWNAYDTWPCPQAVASTWFFEQNGSLSKTANTAATIGVFTDCVDQSGYDRKTDNLAQWLDDFVLGATRCDRLLFKSEPFKHSVTISGTVQANLKGSLDQQTGILSVMVVDYGERKRTLQTLKTIVPNGISYGDHCGAEDLKDFETDEAPSPYRVITRGHMNVQNRQDCVNAQPVVPHEAYRFGLALEPTEYTLPAGHQLGVIVYGTDMQATTRPFAQTQFKMMMEECSIAVPIVTAK